MIIAISQPTLYPWIGFFDIIEKSDIFVFLDDVQFNRHGWQQNNRIKDPKSDEEVWLNIPIKKANLENTLKCSYAMACLEQKLQQRCYMIMEYMM